MNLERKIRKCVGAINQNKSSVELRAEHRECSECREWCLFSQSIPTSDPVFEDSTTPQFLLYSYNDSVSTVLYSYCTRNRADLKRSIVEDLLRALLSRENSSRTRMQRHRRSKKKRDCMPVLNNKRWSLWLSPQSFSQSYLWCQISGLWYAWYPVSGICIRCRALALVAPAELLMNPQRLLMMNSLLPTIF